MGGKTTSLLPTTKDALSLLADARVGIGLGNGLQQFGDAGFRPIIHQGVNRPASNLGIRILGTLQERQHETRIIH